MTPAFAVSYCYDYIALAQRLATIEGTNANSTVVAGENAVVNAFGGVDVVRAAPGAVRVAACLGAGDDGFSEQSTSLTLQTLFSVRGEDGNDVINGGPGNDSLYGDAGNDVIDGRAGNDFLRGSAGNDLIYGNNGNDNIDGGSGTDTIYGENGDDIISGGSDGGGTIDGGPGFDQCGGSGTKVNCESIF